MSSQKHSVAGALKPYVAGGSAACVATMCVHPLDLLKTRVQVQIVAPGEARLGSIKMAQLIVREGGVTKLYAGLSAAIMRQAVYGTARLGLHDQLSKMFRDRNGGNAIPLYQKVIASMVSGRLAVLLVTRSILRWSACRPTVMLPSSSDVATPMCSLRWPALRRRREF